MVEPTHLATRTTCHPGVAFNVRYATYDADPNTAGSSANAYMTVNTVNTTDDDGETAYDLNHPDADNYGPMAAAGASAGASAGGDFDGFDGSDTDI